MGFESLILHQVFGLEVFMDAHNTVTVEEGDRYPSRPPVFGVSVAVKSAIKYGSPFRTVLSPT